MLFFPHLFLYFRNFDAQNNVGKTSEKSISGFFNTLKINAGLLSLVFVLFFVNQIFATNYYIATTGSDAANGTAIGTPKLTLASVFSTYDLNSGDIINVAAGTYTEKGIVVGTTDDGFTIQGAALSSGVPTSIFDSDQTERWLRMSADANDNISFVNLKIKDYKPSSVRHGGAIDYSNGNSSPTGYDITGITITNCFFDNCDPSTGKNGGAIYYYKTSGGASTISISGCSFYNSTGTVDGPSIYIDNNAGITLTISKSKIYDNSTSGSNAGYGIYINSGAASTFSLTNSLIHSNSSAGSGNGAIYLGANITFTAYNNTIYNNTCVACTGAGIYQNGSGSYLNIYNSIIQNNSIKDYYKNSGTLSNMNNCFYTNFSHITGSGNVTTAANVTNAATDDYTLLSTSACINAGQTSGAPSDDITSTTRVGNPDIGCYEYICPTSYSGTYTVGTAVGSTWATITAALASLKLCQTGNVILELDETYRQTQEALETYPLNFNGLLTTGSVSLTIRPKSNVTATITLGGSSGTTLLDFNGTDYVTIDGRLGGSGANTLTIENENTGAGSAIKFSNDATNNTVKYCTLKSNFGSLTEGIVNFSTTTGSTGNDNNTITYCVLDGTATTASPAAAGTAQNGIYSAGHATYTNNTNIISYCEFKDIFVTGGTTVMNGVYLNANNTNWTISNNSFYQTSSRTATGTSATVYGIQILGGSQYTISSNSIGGSGASCSGTWTQALSGSITSPFVGISLTATAGASASTISSNTIAAFNVPQVSGEGWKGIEVLAGNVTIGGSTSADGNIIGATSGTGSITLVKANNGTASEFRGIQVTSANTVTIQYNTIGSVTVSNASNQFLNFFGIKTTSTATYTISNNTIGTATASSIQMNGASTSGYFKGIYNDAAGSVTISSNNIGCFNIGIGYFVGIEDNVAASSGHTISSNTIGTTTANSITNTSLQTATNNNIGIYIQSTGTYTINSNTIQNITLSGAAATTIVGIKCVSTGTYNMNGNTIKYLKNSNTGAFAGSIKGIQFDAAVTSSTIQKNRITNCSSSQTGSPSISGIYNWQASTLLFYNNFISCNNESGTNAVYIYGINHEGSFSATFTLYYNTIKIFGTPSSGTCTSYCFFYEGSADNKIIGFKNNLLYNSRTTNGSHYLYRLPTTKMLSGASNYNYFYNATDATFAYPSAVKTKAEMIASQALQGYGGANSVYANSSPVTINDDGSLSTSDLAIVTTGADLDATSGCETDIYYVARNTSGGYKGCYEGPCLIVATQPAVGSICVGGTYSPSIVVTNATTISTTFSYQMQFASDNSAFASVANSTPANSTYTNGTATSASVSASANAASYAGSVTGSIAAGSAYYYRYIIISSAGCSLYTNSAQLTISASNTISSQSTATQTVCPGVSFSSISVTASGANLGYQWYSNNSSSNTGGDVISSETANSYTPVSNVVGTKYYYCVVSGTCGANISSTVSGALIVNAPMTTTASSGDYVWKGANSTWSTVSNWLSYNGTYYSVASVEPSSSNRTIISALNSCAITQPVLGANSTVGSLIIEPSSSLSNSSYNLDVYGNFTNNGTYTASTGTVTFTGSGTISGSSAISFNNLTINGSSISVTLGRNLTVTGVLTLTLGNLNLDNYNLTLTGSSPGGSSNSYINTNGTGALVKSVSSTGVNYIFPIGQGAYSPFTLNFTSGTFTSATITAYTKPEKPTGLNSANTYYINRHWSIEPSGIDVNPSNLNYTITLNYVDGDRTGTGTESTLKPVKVSSGTWYKPTGSSFTDGTFLGTSSTDEDANTLTWSGLTSFSSFGGTGNGVVALPISLISFTGKNVGVDNELKWVTASEKNNNYFTIEKTIDGTIFDILGVVNGAGTSNAILDYKFTDYNVSSIINYYRLKQTDFDGVFKYTDLISIDNRSSKVEKQIATITNILGQEVNENFRGLVIIVYTDGSSEKVIR